MLDSHFCIHAIKGPFINMNQLKSIYNSPFKNSYSHPIHTCLATIPSNEAKWFGNVLVPSEGKKFQYQMMSSLCADDSF